MATMISITPTLKVVDVECFLSEINEIYDQIFAESLGFTDFNGLEIRKER